MQALGDGPSVLGLERQNLQNEQVERSLRQVDSFMRHDDPYCSDRNLAQLLTKHKGSPETLRADTQRPSGCHRGAGITLRVYAHWLPDGSAEKLVNLLDSNQPSATPQPNALTASERVQLSALNGMVSRILLSWNQLERWLRRVEVLRLAS